MDKTQINITAAICHKSAVELLKGITASTLTHEELYLAVDIMARALYAKHSLWLLELYKQNEKN